MTKNATFSLVGHLPLVCTLVTSACSESDNLPVGPCNSDGDSSGWGDGGDEGGAAGSGLSELEISSGLSEPGTIDELRPTLPELD